MSHRHCRPIRIIRHETGSVTKKICLGFWDDDDDDDDDDDETTCLYMWLAAGLRR